MLSLFAARASTPGDLGRRLQRLARVFPIDPIAAQVMGPNDVVTYYEQCFDAYRRHHSSEGALHVALNREGRFGADGFYGQVRRLERVWSAAVPRDVLELGFGQGFNIRHLAGKFPQTRFCGLDLTPKHVEHVTALLAQRGLGNVELRQGDFHTLPYADASFDHAYSIEAFCYATDTPRALAELGRVLRPGGTLTLFDGYLPRPLGSLTPEEALACRLVAKGVALETFQVIDELLAQARDAGFELLIDDALDAETMPGLERLERLTGAVIRWPWLGRRALARRSAMRGRNVLAGYLLRSTVALGLHAYRQFTWCKAG